MHKGGDAHTQLAVLLVDLVDTLAESFEPLILRGAHLGKLGVGRLAQIVEPVDDRFVPFHRLLIDTGRFGFQIGVGFAQFFEVGFHTGAGALQICNQFQTMRDVCSNAVQPGIEALPGLGHLGDAAAHFLIDDLDGVLIAHDVAPHQIELPLGALDRLAQLMSSDGIAIADRLLMFPGRADFLEPAIVGTGIVGFAARCFQQLADMGLQRPDRSHCVFQPLVHIADLLPGAVLVDGTGPC